MAFFERFLTLDDLLFHEKVVHYFLDRDVIRLFGKELDHVFLDRTVLIWAGCHRRSVLKWLFKQIKFVHAGDRCLFARFHFGILLWDSISHQITRLFRNAGILWVVHGK